MQFGMKIDNVKQLETKLKNLEKKVAKKIITKALKESTKIIQRTAKANIMFMLAKAKMTIKGNLKKGEKQRLKSSMAGKMAKALVVRTGKAKRGIYLVEALYDKKYNDDFVYVSKDGKRSYIPAAIEYGHKLVAWGHRTGKKVAPVPVMRNAWDTKKGEAEIHAMKMIRDGTENEAKKP